MRIPVAVGLESRDGTTTKDPKVVNAIVEPQGETAVMRARPGNQDLGLVITGNPQGLYYFNGQIFSIHSNTVYRSTLGPLANVGVGVFAGPRVISVAAAAGTTITVSTAGDHGFVTGEGVTIAGAVEPEYNGNYFISAVTSSNGFQYVVPIAPASTPATGSPTATPLNETNTTPFSFAENGLIGGANGILLVKGAYTSYRVKSDWSLSQPVDYSRLAIPGGLLVPGCEYLDGYFFVMDLVANIYNCDLNADPGTPVTGVWRATSFLRAGKETGQGVFLGRSLNYLVALKEFSTEVFYDAGNPAPGSPLAPVDSAFSNVGCASAGSVASVEGSLLWVSQSARGRGVQMMQGPQQMEVSTPDVCRIIDNDSLATVYAYGMKIAGHSLYVLTLVASDITLVYDIDAKTWSQWTSLTAGANVSVSTITRDGTTATVTTAAAHGLNDGDPVLMAGATQPEYNGIFQVSRVSSTVFTIRVTGSPATPATGTITAAPYTESRFKFSHYVNAGGRDILMHETDGHLYEILPSLHQDAGIPINVFTRTARMDGGGLFLKRMSRLAFVADSVGDFIMVRWSDDDSATFNAYRSVDLSLDRPRVRRCGPFRRRTVETRFIGNNPLRIEAIELEAQQ